MSFRAQREIFAVQWLLNNDLEDFSSFLVEMTFGLSVNKSSGFILFLV